MDKLLDLAWFEVEIEREREQKNARMNEYTDPFNSASTDLFNLAAFNLPDIEPWDISMHGSTGNRNDPINEFDLIGSAYPPLAPENDDANIAKEKEEELGRKQEGDPDWDPKTTTDYDGTYVYFANSSYSVSILKDL